MEIQKNKLEFLWKRQYSVFQGVGAMLAFFDWTKENINQNITTRSESDGVWLSAYATKGSLAKINKVFIDRAKKSQIFLSAKMNRLHKRGGQFVNFSKKLSASSKQDYIKEYLKYSDFYRYYCLSLWDSFYFAEETGKRLNKVLKNKVKGKDWNNAVMYYSQHNKPLAVFKIHEYFKKETNLNKRVKYIKRNFPWIVCVDPFTTTNFESLTREYASTVEIPHIQRINFETLRLNGSEKRIIDLYQQGIYIKDKRDEYRRQSFYYAQPFLKAFCKKFGINLMELSVIGPHELDLLLMDKSLIVKEARKRLKGCVVDFDKERLTFTIKAKFNDSHKNIRVVKGLIGCRGKVTGVVQQIRSLADIKKFKKDRILVAITTNPNHLPAMYKAAAFVTDEGSITSHSSIIAREINKPCVVGTKIATKIFKDGDLIEVDANKGIVRKI